MSKLIATLATARENGYAPRDTIDGGRCTIPAGLTTDGKPYSPGGETTGVITLRTAIMSEELRSRLAIEGAEPLPSTPEEYGVDIDREETQWSKVVKASGAKPE